MNAEILGTLPGWITSVGVLTILARVFLGGKKITVDADGNLRTHYGSELQSLRDQIIKMGQHHLDREREIDDRWRKLLEESEKRHADCVKQREELASEVAEVKERQLGTIRQFITFQKRFLDVLPPDMKSPALVHAIESLQPFTDDAALEWKMPPQGTAQ